MIVQSLKGGVEQRGWLSLLIVSRVFAPAPGSAAQVWLETNCSWLVMAPPTRGRVMARVGV